MWNVRKTSPEASPLPADPGPASPAKAPARAAKVVSAEIRNVNGIYPLQNKSFF